MNRMTRNAVACALAAGVALGAAAPAALAAPKGTHAKMDHRSTKAHKHVKVSKADRKLSGAERKVTKQAGAKTRYLVRLADSRQVKRLDDAVEQAVQLNIGQDVTELNDLAATAGSTDLKALSGDLRSIRPEVYQRIIADLRFADRLQAALAGMTDADPALVAEVDGVIQTLLTYDAGTSRTELQKTHHALAMVADALDPEADEPEADEPEADEPDAPESDTPDSGTGTGTDTGTDTGTGTTVS